MSNVHPWGNVKRQYLGHESTHYRSEMSTHELRDSCWRARHDGSALKPQHAGSRGRKVIGTQGQPGLYRASGQPGKKNEMPERKKGGEKREKQRSVGKWGGGEEREGGGRESWLLRSISIYQHWYREFSHGLVVCWEIISFPLMGFGQLKALFVVEILPKCSRIRKIETIFSININISNIIKIWYIKITTKKV